MQLSQTTENHGKFLARSLLTSQQQLLDREAPVYFFTIGAAQEFITSDLLTRCAFCSDEVYVRTDHGVYVLEHFRHLKDVQAFLSDDDYFSANRGVLVNEHKISCPGGSRSIEFHLRDPKGQPTIERVRLSKRGMREFKERVFLRPHPTR